jgi:hypothetical protein
MATLILDSCSLQFKRSSNPINEPGKAPSTMSRSPRLGSGEQALSCAL